MYKDGLLHFARNMQMSLMKNPVVGDPVELQVTHLLRKTPMHISPPMHTVQTNNQIVGPRTGKPWLTYRN